MMKQNKLIILAVLFAVIALWAYLSGSPKPVANVGEPVVSPFEVNDVNHIVAVTPDQTNTVSFIDNEWIVTSYHNFPANFATVRETVNAIANARVGQIKRGQENNLDAFGLGTNKTTFTLKNEQEDPLAYIEIGDTWERGGQYVRRDTGPVMLISPGLQRLPQRDINWVNRRILSVNADQLREITLSQNNTNLVLKVLNANQFMLEGMDDTTEKTHEGNAGRLARLLANFSFIDITEPFETPEVTAQFTTRDNTIYTIELGPRAEENRRVMRVSVSPETNALSRVTGWTYLISGFTAEPLLFQRDDLIQSANEETTGPSPSE